eukprot:236942-Hanusia_phi.AAC.2
MSFTRTVELRSSVLSQATRFLSSTSIAALRDLPAAALLLRRKELTNYQACHKPGKYLGASVIQYSLPPRLHLSFPCSHRVARLIQNDYPLLINNRKSSLEETATPGDQLSRRHQARLSLSRERSECGA